MCGLQSIPTLEEVLEAASVFDQNGNGYISSDELRHVMKELGEGLDDETLAQMIKVAEPDSEHQVCCSVVTLSWCSVVRADTFARVIVDQHPPLCVCPDGRHEVKKTCTAGVPCLSYEFFLLFFSSSLSFRFHHVWLWLSYNHSTY